MIVKGLPAGWTSATLTDACIVERGVTFPASAKRTQPSDNTIACLRTANVQETVKWDDLIYIPKEFVKADVKLVRVADILISMANSRELVGKVSYVNSVPVESTLGGFIAALRASSLVDSRYLFYFLKSSSTQNALRSQASQTVNIANLSLNGIYSMSIRVAPLSEQRRIVDAIEQQFTRLDAGVAALKRAQAALKRYRATVLKAAVEGKLTEAWRAAHPDVEPASKLLERILAERRAKWAAGLRAKGKDPSKAKYIEPQGPDATDLPELPKGWVWATVEQTTVFLRNGLSQKPESIPPGHRILRINAVRPMSVNLDEVRYLAVPADDVADYFIENGDLLYTRYNGSVDLLGVAGMVRNCIEPTLHPDKLIRVKTAEQGVLPSFIELASNTGYSRAHIESRARTTAGQTGISGTDIKQMPIPLPPLREQELIVSEVEQRLSVVSELEVTVEHNLKRAERLRQSILERAFSGQLVPQDPNDEPASVLLERIRRERNENANGHSGAKQLELLIKE